MDGKNVVRVSSLVLLVPLLLAGSEKSSAQLDSTQVRNAPSVLFIYGNAAHTVALDAALVRAMPQTQIKAVNGTSRKTEKYSGVPLKDLLARAGVVTDASISLTAVSNDGSKSILSRTDTEAAFHDGSQVIVADTANGKPLDASDGPLMLVILGGTGPIRSVPNLARIQVNTAK